MTASGESGKKARVSPRLLRDPVHFLSFGCGTGLAPFAPGTFGTLLGIPLWLLLQDVSLIVYLFVLVVLLFGGAWVAGRTSRALGTHDHGAIVIDEVLGFLVAMTAAPQGWQWIVAGFLAFRLFDIWKPWPVSLADRRVHGGIGIMLDDLLAGLWALVCLQLAQRFF
jgi:phosphatidylglycerophosphatase A